MVRYNLAMAPFRVAFVGRPNVGKSSILNMLARAKVSIVDPTPGVTRDRVTRLIRIEKEETGESRVCELIDTGGYGIYTAEGRQMTDAGEDLGALTDDIEHQIDTAVNEADLILFVLDTQAGITPLDETIAKRLRQRATGKKRTASGGREGGVEIQIVANKVDALKWEPHAYEFSALGFTEPWLVSALNNYNRAHFRELLFEKLPEDSAGSEPEEDLRFALIGRRNAGKSSFINALAGEERVIVSEIAGTTRDAVDVRFEIDGRTLTAIDTAGMRKRTKFADRIEHFAYLRMHEAIKRADVAILMLDATQRISGIDKRLGRRIQDTFTPCVVVVSKWDLVEGQKTRKGEIVTPEDYEKYIDKEMPGLSTCPIVFTSSKDRVGLKQVINIAFELFKQARERMTTGQVNRVIRTIIKDRGPSGRLGTQAKILFASQVAVSPPTLVLVVNHPKLFEGSYLRYVLNRLRELTPVQEVPIRLIVRARRRAELEELLSGAHKRSRAAFKVLEAEASGDVRAFDELTDDDWADAYAFEEELLKSDGAEGEGAWSGDDDDGFDDDEFDDLDDADEADAHPARNA